MTVRGVSRVGRACVDFVGLVERESRLRTPLVPPPRAVAPREKGVVDGGELSSAGEFVRGIP